MKIDKHEKLKEGMLNPMRDKFEGMHRREEGKAPVIMAWFVQKVAEGTASYYRVKVIMIKPDFFLRAPRVMSSSQNDKQGGCVIT